MRLGSLPADPVGYRSVGISNEYKHEDYTTADQRSERDRACDQYNIDGVSKLTSLHDLIVE